MGKDSSMDHVGGGGGVSKYIHIYIYVYVYIYIHTYTEGPCTWAIGTSSCRTAVG